MTCEKEQTSLTKTLKVEWRNEKVFWAKYYKDELCQGILKYFRKLDRFIEQKIRIEICFISYNYEIENRTFTRERVMVFRW